MMDLFLLFSFLAVFRSISVAGQCTGSSSDYSVQYGTNSPAFLVSRSNGSCYCVEWVGRHSGDGSRLTNLTGQPDIAQLQQQVAAQSVQIAAQAAQIEWLMVRLSNLTSVSSGGLGTTGAVATTGAQPAIPNSAGARAAAQYTATGTSFAAVPGMSVNVTTAGYPVLVFANADLTLAATGTCSVSIFRDGVTNLGLSNGLGQVSDAGAANNIQWAGVMAIDNAPLAGRHTYTYQLAVASGSAVFQAQSTTPAIAAIELNKPGLNWGFASSTTVTDFVSTTSWTPAAGLSFELSVATAGSPVLLFANVPWISTVTAWVAQSFLRNGTEISGVPYGYGVNYGSAANSQLINSFVAIDFPPRGGHQYTYACLSGTNPVGPSSTNNVATKAWVAGIELSKTFNNYNYTTWSVQTTVSSLDAWSQLGTLTTSVVSTGAVFLYAMIDHNPSPSSRTAYSIFRDGVNLGGVNGLVVCSGPDNWNELCNIMFLDSPTPGLHRYSVQFKTLTAGGSMLFNDVAQAYNLVVVDVASLVKP